MGDKDGRQLHSGGNGAAEDRAVHTRWPSPLSTPLSMSHRSLTTSRMQRRSSIACCLRSASRCGVWGLKLWRRRRAGIQGWYYGKCQRRHWMPLASRAWKHGAAAGLTASDVE
eukprot:255381-Chlamydomonas_euryale.AAC.1